EGPKAVLAASNPVAFFSNSIGDHVVALPALRAVANAFDGRLALLCSRAAPGFLFDELPLRSLVQVEFGIENNTKEFDVAGAIRELGTCDLFVSLVPWRCSSLATLVKRIPQAVSIGFAEEFGIRVPRKPSAHMADVIFQAAQAVSL